MPVLPRKPCSAGKVLGPHRSASLLLETEAGSTTTASRFFGETSTTECSLLLQKQNVPLQSFTGFQGTLGRPCRPVLAFSWLSTPPKSNFLRISLFRAGKRVTVEVPLGHTVFRVSSLSLKPMFQNCVVLWCGLWLFRSWGKSFFPVPAGTRSETRPCSPKAGF